MSVFAPKYFSVIAVTLAIFIGVILFLINIERRIRKFEKNIYDEEY